VPTATISGPERRLERAVGGRPERLVVGSGIAQPLEPVVDRPVQRDHVDPLAQERDERQEQLALQPVPVEPLGRPVRGRDHDHALLEQPGEQPAQDHRVGDVDDVELVEAEQPDVARDVGRDRAQRIGELRPALLVQALLRLEHEGVEMHPPGRDRRGGRDQQVHQHRLAAADRAPEIDPARCRRRRRAAGEAAEQAHRAALFDGRHRERVGELLQPQRRRRLLRIGAKLTLGELLPVELERSGHGGCR
jgi:hypothetical protein